jgi:hypothetical protein
LLPGIWPSLHLDTAITLSVGVEAYAAYALHAWLARHLVIGAVHDQERQYTCYTCYVSNKGSPIPADGTPRTMPVPCLWHRATAAAVTLINAGTG